MKQLLIVGIDPGTTTAYALLDVHGKIVELKSAKELSVDSLISRVTKIGIPVCVGCDKAKVPAFVERFAVQVNARLFAPSEDLKIEEKRKLTKGMHFKNAHEMDALASAIIAFNRVESLFRRIDKFLEGKKKKGFSDKVKELVVKKGISISGALDLLTRPEKPEKIIKKVVEERKLFEKDFLELYNDLKKAVQEKELLQKQNKKLAQELKQKKAPKKVKMPKIKNIMKMINLFLQLFCLFFLFCQFPVQEIYLLVLELHLLIWLYFRHLYFLRCFFLL